MVELEYKEILYLEHKQILWVIYLNLPYLSIYLSNPHEVSQCLVYPNHSFPRSDWEQISCLKIKRFEIKIIIIQGVSKKTHF